MQQTVKRGDIFWSRVPTVSGCGNGVMQKVRPVLIISNNKANYAGNIYSVIPISARLHKLNKACHVMIHVFKPSVLLPEQITTVNRENLYGKILHLDESQLQIVDSAIKKQLGLKANWIRKISFKVFLFFFGRHCFGGADFALNITLCWQYNRFYATISLYRKL